MRVFEMRTAIRRENFACQDSAVSQIFILIISNGEKILSNGNVFVGRQVKRENSSLPLAVRVSKTRVLKLPNVHHYSARKFTCHAMHQARALSTKMNNDRADGHCYSFAWI